MANEQTFLDQIKKNPGDTAFIRVFADYLQDHQDKDGELLAHALSRGDQDGQVAVCLIAAKKELARITDVKSKVDKFYTDWYAASQERMVRNGHAPRDTSADVEFSSVHALRNWDKLSKYVQHAVDTPSVAGMKRHVTVCQRILLPFVRKRTDDTHLSLVTGTPLVDSPLANDPHGVSANEWLDIAAKQAKNRKGSPKQTTVQRRLVDILRKKYGNSEFTGKQAAVAHLEAQKESGKTPLSHSAQKGMADFHQHTSLILDRISDRAGAWNGINTKFTLKDDAEKVVDKRTPKMSDVFKDKK